MPDSQSEKNSKLQASTSTLKLRKSNMAELPAALPPDISEQKPQPSLLARMLNVVAAPGDSFDAIKDKEPDHGNWLSPALLLLLVSWVGAWVVFSQPSIQQQMREATDKAIDRQIASQHLSQEQGDKMREAAEKVGGIGQKVAVFAMPAFVAFVTPFFVGLIFWLVAEFAWKAELPYMKVVEVIGLATMIAVLDAIVRSLLILITGKVWAAFSPALLIKDFDPSNALH